MSLCISVGKSLGNGHPLAAVVTTKEIAKKFMTYFSYYNYLGDPLSCAIGCAVLDQLKDGQLAANVTRVGEYLKKRLIESVSTQFNFVGQVRGLGLSLGVDIVVGTGGPNACDPNASLCHVIRNKMVKRQVRKIVQPKLTLKLHLKFRYKGQHLSIRAVCC